MTNKTMFVKRKTQESYLKEYFDEIDRKLREKIQASLGKRK